MEGDFFEGDADIGMSSESDELTDICALDSCIQSSSVLMKVSQVALSRDVASFNFCQRKAINVNK